MWYLPSQWNLARVGLPDVRDHICAKDNIWAFYVRGEWNIILDINGYNKIINIVYYIL